MSTLCRPATGLTCFRCCPPIRPAGYDHLDYVSSLRRELAENRRRFLDDGPSYRPIVGYHCWALGFLDKQGLEVGCQLHPIRNGGRDLRHLVDYGNKCERESCLAAKMFALLPPEGQRFWLPLAAGLSAFRFSSPRSNPLFHVLHWGPRLLESLRLHAGRYDWSVTELIWHQSFLVNPQWDPRGHHYLFHLAMDRVAVEPAGRWELEDFSRRLWLTLRTLPDLAPSEPDSSCGTYTHLLPVEADVGSFVRTALGWRRITWRRLLEIQETVLGAARDVLLSFEDPEI